MTRRLFNLLTKIETFHTTVSTLHLLTKLPPEITQQIKTNIQVWRLLVDTNKYDNEDFNHIIHFSKVRSLSLVSPKMPKNILTHFNELDELKELSIMADLLPQILDIVMTLPLKKIIIYYCQIANDTFTNLFQHKTCKEIIIYSFIAKEVIRIRETYPKAIVVFQTDFLPVTPVMADFILSQKIFLSKIFLRIDSFEMESPAFLEIFKLYLPALHVSDCQQNTPVPTTHSLGVDTYFPKVVETMTSLVNFDFMEKMGQFPECYNFSQLTQLTELKLFANYKRTRKILLPTSLVSLCSNCFIENSKDVIVEKKRGITSLRLKKLTLCECSIDKIPEDIIEISIISTLTPKTLKFTRVTQLKLCDCNVKNLTIPSSCQALTLECTSLQNLSFI